MKNVYRPVWAILLVFILCHGALWAEASQIADNPSNHDYNGFIRTNPLPAINPCPGDMETLYFWVAWGDIFGGTTVALSWQADPSGPAPNGYKIIFNGGTPIDLGPQTTWTTDFLMEGYYSWQVIPYIVDRSGSETDLPLLVQSNSSGKGDAENCPVWNFDIFADYELPPVASYTLLDLSCIQASESVISISWNIADEYYMGYYYLLRGTSQDENSAVLVPGSEQSAYNYGYGVTSYGVDDTGLSYGTYYYWLIAVDYYGMTFGSEGPWEANLVPVAEDDPLATIPAVGINRIFPNPVRVGQNCSIHYRIDTPGTMDIYNARGQKVWTTSIPGGENIHTWDGRNFHGTHCASGIYLCRITSLGSETSARLVLLQEK